jgi:hypothetical protein
MIMTLRHAPRVNKVGPYNNPQETYNYYYLPFCKQFDEGKEEHSWGGLGEVLQGNELINSQIDIKFQGGVHVPHGHTHTQLLFIRAKPCVTGGRPAMQACMHDRMR